MYNLGDSWTWWKTSLLSPSLDPSSFRHRLRRGSLHRSLLLWERGLWRGEEGVGDEVFEADPVLGVPLEQVVQQVGELGRGAAWHPGGQSSVPLVELLQSLIYTKL